MEDLYILCSFSDRGLTEISWKEEIDDIAFRTCSGVSFPTFLMEAAPELPEPEYLRRDMQD